MFIGWTEEQQQLRESVRGLLARVSTHEQVRRLMATPNGHDRDAWARLHELGLVGVVVPEGLGGGGGSFVDQGVVLEEMGRSAFCGAYFSTAVLAVQTLLHLDHDPVVAVLLRRICDGQLVTLALGGLAGRWGERAGEVKALPTPTGWRLDGTTTFVPDGAVADAVIVVASSTQGQGLFVVEAGADGVGRTPLPTMDQTRKLARLDLTATPAQLLGTEDGAWRALEPALQVASIALAVEQVGGAQFVLDMAVEYASVRHQFERPIGSFQAVQHKCAAMLVEIEAARSAAYYGLRVASEHTAELPAVASIAKSFCSTAFRHATDEAIQIFGGVGLTWEHPIHIYFKRARSSEIFLGAPAYHRELLAQQLAL